MKKEFKKTKMKDLKQNVDFSSAMKRADKEAKKFKKPEMKNKSRGYGKEAFKY